MPKYDERDFDKIIKQEAFVTGFRNNTIRLKLKGKKTTALCTVTYSSDMNTELQQRVAERIAMIWNIYR
jgi:LPS O-antigen subunit length determinant protein (WzzB/FepE family)